MGIRISSRRGAVNQRVADSSRILLCTSCPPRLLRDRRVRRRHGGRRVPSHLVASRPRRSAAARSRTWPRAAVPTCSAPATWPRTTSASAADHGKMYGLAVPVAPVRTLRRARLALPAALGPGRCPGFLFPIVRLRQPLLGDPGPRAVPVLRAHRAPVRLAIRATGLRRRLDLSIAAANVWGAQHAMLQQRGFRKLVDTTFVVGFLCLALAGAARGRGPVLQGAAAGSAGNRHRSPVGTSTSGSGRCRSSCEPWPSRAALGRGSGSCRSQNPGTCTPGPTAGCSAGNIFILFETVPATTRRWSVDLPPLWQSMTCLPLVHHYAVTGDSGTEAAFIDRVLRRAHPQACDAA